MDGTFNALLTDREHYVNRKEFLRDNTYGIAGTLKECFATLQGSYEAVREDMGDLRGITDNIIYFGLPESAKKAMEGTGSAKLSLKNALDTRSERTASYRSAHGIDARRVVVGTDLEILHLSVVEGAGVFREGTLHMPAVGTAPGTVGFARRLGGGDLVVEDARPVVPVVDAVAADVAFTVSLVRHENWLWGGAINLLGRGTLPP